MEKVFIFDYDDTLAPCQIDYEIAKLKFLEFMRDKTHPMCPDIFYMIGLQASIDNSLVKSMGFSKERFPTSIVHAYGKVCEGLKIPALPKEEKTLYDIGMQAFDKNTYKRRGLLPGAEDTLKFLKEKNDTLILYTKGDPEVQEMKIQATKVRRFFPNIKITQKKTVEELESLIGDTPKERVWHVGNSIASDVLPTYAAELNMIYVPFETWLHERDHNGLPEFKKSKLYVFDKISDIIDRYDELNKRNTTNNVCESIN